MTLKEKMKDTLSIGKQGKSEDMLKEMNLKMQRVLEETLEKNIQMEKVKILFIIIFNVMVLHSGSFILSFVFYLIHYYLTLISAY